MKVNKVDLPLDSMEEDQSHKFCITLDNILTKEECEDLIRITEASGYSEALVNTGFGQQTKMTDFRNSDRCILDSKPVA